MRRIWPKGGGIYAVEVNGQPVYVGKANVFSSRFGSHVYALKRRKCKNRSLQTAFDAVGSCTFHVLETIDGSGEKFQPTIERAWVIWMHQMHGLTNIEHVLMRPGGVPLELVVQPKGKDK